MMTNFIDEVLQEVGKWQPAKNYRSEIKYTEDLHSALREKFQNSQVTRDDKNNKKGLDIGIIHQSMYGDISVGIELKYNLDKTAEYHRLIGQIETKGWRYGHIVVVLVGQTNNNMYINLNNWVKSKRNVITGVPQKPIYIVSKGSLE